MRIKNTHTARLSVALLSISSVVYAATTDTTGADDFTQLPASQGCKTALTNLNGDTSLQTYLNTLDAVTSAGNKATSNTSLTNTLDQICSKSSSAAATGAIAIRNLLGNVWNSCMPEIQSTDPALAEIRDIYDLLYLLLPFQTAICSKDAASNNYCVQNIASYSNGTSASRRSVMARQAAPTSSTSSNNTAEIGTLDNEDSQQPNFAFLYLNAAMDKSVLCGSCTPQILKAYIGFEMQSPYAIGLSNSDLFKGQSALYKAVEQQCGDDVMSQINTVDTIGKFLVTQSGAQQLSRPVILTIGLVSLVSTVVLSL